MPADDPPLFTHKVPDTMSASLGLTPKPIHSAPQQAVMPPITSSTYRPTLPHPGPGVIPSQPTIKHPVQTNPYVNVFQSTVCHHLDKIAHPEVTSKSGSFESIKRLEEIWAFCASGPDTLPVHLRPDIVGKQLAIQLKALNTQLWSLREQLAIPVARSNKLRLGAALMAWGVLTPIQIGYWGNRTSLHGHLQN